MDHRAHQPNIRLAPRLAQALSMLPQSHMLVDVGCDHGKLCLAALFEGKASRVVAVDVSEASLAKARTYFDKFGLSAEFVRADGIAFLDPADSGDYTAALCGMGGELIADILARGESAARAALALVLQPMGGERELRGWLFANGYAILDEDTVLDAGRYYQLILVRCEPKSVRAYRDEVLLEFGALNYARRPDALRGLLEKVYASRARRMERAKRSGAVPASLESGLAGVRRLLDHWEDQP